MTLYTTKMLKQKIKCIVLCFFTVNIFVFSNNILALEPDVENDRTATVDLVEGIKSRDGRWFEVEVIIFKRTESINLREQFSQDVKSLTKRRQWDLIRDLLQPDISNYLAGLPECHQDKNPLANINPESPLSAADFYQKMMDYQELINSKWQFTNELCLMPNESLSGYWRLVNTLPNIDKNEFKQVSLNTIPQKVTAGDHDDFHDVYVIADQNLQLKSEFNKLKRNPNTEPMLHIGWRQPGLSKRQSRPVYIVAGDNYTKQFRYDGSEKLDVTEETEVSQQDTNSADLKVDIRQNVKNFMKRLQAGAMVDFKNSTLIYPKQKNLPDETWQLDGFIQVHLDHYLYIDSQFNFRELSTESINPELYMMQTNVKNDENDAESILENQQGSVLNPQENAVISEEELVTINFLKNYTFNQTRKLYSGELHYLDHPKMGILIQIRKYRH